MSPNRSICAICRGLLAAAAAALLLWTPGCATPTDRQNAESDLPWNRQEAWEGQLLMPGSMMPGQY